VLLSLLALAACTPEVPAPVPAPRPVETAPAPLVPVAGACADTPDAGAAAEETEYADQRNAKEKPDKAGDTCAVADSNLKRAADAILAGPRATAPAASKAWDHRKKPARLDAVAKRFALSKAEIAALEKNGFVVPARLETSTYAYAYHEIYQSEMPLYVSVDAILHAVFIGNDQVLARLEKRRLAPLLDRTLAAMACALPAASASYPQDSARDLDVYLAVARSLLADAPVAPVFEGDAPQVSALFEQAKKAQGMSVVEIFGRPRKIDFTAFTPRGHYASDERTTPYFRASMWLSRLEFNLVSRSSMSSAASELADPRETPREAVTALALADLAARAGVNENVRALDRAWTIFGGKREDVSLADLAELRAKAAIGSLTEPRVFERLKEAIGEKYQRTTRIHYMPEGTTVLPAISTFLGPRIVADTTATGPLVEPKTRDRHMIGAADMGFVLGHDRAESYLAAEVSRYPDLKRNLADARAAAHAPAKGEDLYGLWLRAILALAERPAGTTPSFMSTEAYADLRLDSAITAFGQIRHNAVLFAGQGYDQGGCVIPDAYVEPAPAVYEALAAYADRGAAAIGELDPADASKARATFTSLGRVLRVLDVIAKDELAGRALSEDEQRFLAMILEMAPGSSGGPPTYTGWYFDLFPSRADALARADFIADYFTSGYDGVIAYAGATAPRLGVFVVDSGGDPRVVVGPVARGYEHHGPLATRLDDEAASKLPKVDDPWAASYTAPAPPAPPLVMYLDVEKTGHARVEASRAIGKVTIEVLDHHRKVIQAITKDVGKGTTEFPFRRGSEKRPIEAIHLAAGEWHGWSEVSWQGAEINPAAKP
jgi:hypothetical protein